MTRIKTFLTKDYGIKSNHTLCACTGWAIHVHVHVNFLIKKVFYYCREFISRAGHVAIPLSVAIYSNVLIVIHHIKSVPLSKSAEMVCLLWVWSVVMMILCTCRAYLLWRCSSFSFTLYSSWLIEFIDSWKVKKDFTFVTLPPLSLYHSKNAIVNPQG